MKTVKYYQCDCGEDVYEDDLECCNCGRPFDKSELEEVEIADITKEVLPPPHPKS